jgi:glutathione reductase (NADPH)
LRDNVQNEVTRLSGIYNSATCIKAGVTPSRSAPSWWMRTRVKLLKSGARSRRTHSHRHRRRPSLLDGLPGLEARHHLERSLPAGEIPRRILIVGGGYVALEFANIFHGLGAKTRIVHRGDRMLRGFDDDLRAHLHIETERAGMQLTMKTTLTKIDKTGDVLRVTLSPASTWNRPGVVRHRPAPNTARPWPGARGVQLDNTARWSWTIFAEQRRVHLRHRST